MTFPRGTSSILLRKTGLSSSQIKAITHHLEFAHTNFKDDKLLYSWWHTENWELDSWRVHNNCGRIFLWTAYDSFNLGRFIVKLLGDALADEIHIDSWHSVYSYDPTDKYFIRAKLEAAEKFEA